MKPEKIAHVLTPISRFIQNESAAGIFLLTSAVAALVVSNSAWAASYHHWWEIDISIGVGDYSLSRTLHHWINDGLMAMFFFVVGLELKREIVGGELSTPRQALLPLVAAAGGMVVPAAIYLLANPQAPAQDGWGVPMATDIAFVLGILSLLGSRVPLSIKVFLTALAIADDLGAVLVIAFFYTSDISFVNLATGAGFLVVLAMGNHLGVRNAWFYGLVGIGGVWLAFLMSGVHATVAGVLAALAIPARTKIDEVSFAGRLRGYVAEFERIPPNSTSLLAPEQHHVVDKIKRLTQAADTPLQRLEHGLHPIVAFVVMPVFAFSNAGISLSEVSWPDVAAPVSVGVGLGLLVGKFVGVVGSTWLSVRLMGAKLPEGMTWRHLCGVGCLAGVGFTMSLFITNLAFESQSLLLQAKIGTLAASLVAGLIGFLILQQKTVRTP